MSIKRFLIIFSIILILLSLCFFALISNKYMNDYFNDYIDEAYLQNVENIKEYGKLIIFEGQQPRSILNSYVKDPIYYVEVYDLNDNIVTYSGTMNNRFVFDAETMVADSFGIYDKEEMIGYVLISRELKTDNTLTNKLFNRALLSGAVVSLIVTVLIIGIILLFLIKFVSKNVNEVIEYATDDKIQAKVYSIFELNTIVNAIKEYRIKLAIKEKIKKQKFDKLLHETKTPITIIRSQLEGAADGIIKLDKQRTTSMIEEVNNLDFMLKDITNIVEGSSVENQIILKQMDYSNELQKVIISLSPKFNKKNIKLIFNDAEFIIKTNKELLNKTIYNLLINSYKYTIDGSVTISTDNDKKSISIKDTGIGIHKDDIKNIFKPYYRGKNVNGIKGQGLGLSNVKENIEKLGANIEVSSKLGEFTEFKISF